VLPSVWTWKSFTIERRSSDRALARPRKHRIDIAKEYDRMIASLAEIVTPKKGSEQHGKHWVHRGFTQLHERWKTGGV
jgi:hypothetical protein